MVVLVVIYSVVPLRCECVEIRNRESLASYINITDADPGKKICNSCDITLIYETMLLYRVEPRLPIITCENVIFSKGLLRV